MGGINEKRLVVESNGFGGTDKLVLRTVLVFVAIWLGYLMKREIERRRGGKVSV